MRVKLPDAPNVWTDGSLVLDEVSAASSSGSGFSFLPHSWHLPVWSSLRIGSWVPGSVFGD